MYPAPWAPRTTRAPAARTTTRPLPELPRSPVRAPPAPKPLALSEARVRKSRLRYKGSQHGFSFGGTAQNTTGAPPHCAPLPPRKILGRSRKKRTSEAKLEAPLTEDQRIARRVQREWTTSLVPRGLHTTIKLWDTPSDATIDALTVVRRPILLEDEPPPPVEPEKPKDWLEHKDLPPFPVTRLLMDDDDSLLPLDNAVEAAPVAAAAAEAPVPAESVVQRRTRERYDFFQQLKLTAAQRNFLMDPKTGDIDPELEKSMNEEGQTPRQRFLRILASQRRRTGALPIPALLRRRENAPNALDLTGAGFGDTVVGALMEVIMQLEGIDTILLGDNRLTDTSLGPLCDMARFHLPSLTALDLSGNDMDASAKSLRAYLAERKCHLKRLWLSKADVDDRECAEFMTSLAHNRSLEVLSLSQNLIGDAEAVNTANPDVITGGEAIGIMLRDNYRLTDLDVSWNKIRAASAIELGAALAHNTGLTRLNLAYNSFADDATQHLGLALGENNALTELDLSFNAVKATAALVLANAFHRNHTLTSLDLAGNPIGKRGGEAIITAVRRYQLPERFLHVNLANADLEQDTAVDGNLFNPTSPNGTYLLDMTTPYAQIVVQELYRLATTTTACKFAKIIHYKYDEETKEPSRDQGEVIELVRKKIRRRNNEDHIKQHGSGTNEPWAPFAERMEETLQRLCNFKKANPLSLAERKKKKKLQHPSMDSLTIEEEDGEDELHSDVREALKALLESIQAKPNAACLDAVLEKLNPEDHGGLEGLLYAVFVALFDYIDYNQSGSIDVREMCRGLVLLGVAEASIETANRIVSTYDVDGTGHVERNEFVHWALSAFLQKSLQKMDNLIDKRSNAPWRIPKMGVLSIDFESEPRLPGIDLYGTDLGNWGLIRNIELATTVMDRARIFEKAVSNTDIYFTAGQAQDILDQCHVGLNTEDMLTKLLPVMATTGDACTLVEKNLSLQHRTKLRERLGPLFDACTGNPTGFYRLDLRRDRDRKAALKLAELNADQVAVGKASGRRDTSQKGNWQNFRNEFLDEKPIEISTAWFATMPKKGTLRFDYVSTLRPRAANPLSVRDFVQLVKALDLTQLQRVVDYYRNLPKRERRKSSFYSVRSPTVCYDDLDELAVDIEQQALIGGISVEAELLFANDIDDDVLRRSSLGSYASQAPVAAPTSSVVSGLAEDDDDLDDDDEDDDDDDSDASQQGDPEELLDIEMPKWILRRNVVHGWRACKQSCHLKSDWLGLEKYRDMSKALGLVNTPPPGTPGLEKKTDDDPKKRRGGVLGENDPRAIAGADAPLGAPDEDMTSQDTSAAEQEFLPFEYIPTKYTRKDAKSVPVGPYNIIFYKLALLRVATMSVALTIDQAIHLMKQIPTDDFSRVSACVALHSRLADMEDCYKLLDYLEPAEQVEFAHRVGWLNILNPMHPDHVYVLDLRWRDHRELCKCLVKLAVCEPGTNWVHEAYRWSIFDVPIPGWVLPYSWSLDDHELDGQGGPRRFGRLRVRYTSDPAYGCDPNWKTRRNLKARFLCGEIKDY